MANKQDKVFDEVHEAFNQDTSHALARRTVDAVLDKHHEFKGKCYECSLLAPALGVWYPCRTVKAILEVVRG